MSEEQGKENGAEIEEDDLYMEPKSRPKIVRILTVFAYMSSVSMAAILLSVYYIFMWDGQPTLARRRDPHMEAMVDYAPGLHEEVHKIYQEASFENTFDEDEVAKRNSNYTLATMKIVEEQDNQNENISESGATKEDGISTLNSDYVTIEEQNADRGNLKEALKQQQDEVVKPTVELSYEPSSPNPNEEGEAETVEEIESASLPEPKETNKGILPNNKFFYKKLIMA